MNHYLSISKVTTILFFVGIFILGNFIVDDYGVGFDDEIQEKHGWVSYDHINKTFGIEAEAKAPKVKNLKNYQYRAYGVIFQLTALYLDGLFDLKTFEERHLLRHRLVFYLFFLASIFFYRILYRQFDNPYLALLGSLMFILSPRMFGHAFFNIKDSVLLSFFVFGLASFFKYLDDPSIRNGLLHALICGLIVNVRIVGIVVPALSLLWIMVYFMAAKDKKEFWNQWKKSLTAFVLLTPIFITIFWPFLWEKPLHNFVESYEIMGNYAWKGWILFSGKNIYAGKLPWYYIPQWMLVSIPLFYWLLFVCGIGAKPLKWIQHLFKGDLSWFNDRDNRFLIISLSFCVLPIAVVILKNSNIYDGWRQLHFTYVGFLLVAFYGLVVLERMVKKNKKYRNIFYGVVAANMVYLLVVMIQIHPYQQTYFNLLSGTDQFEKYELDYWGISYRNGFKEFAKQIPPGECKKIYVFSMAGRFNYEFLDEETKKKFCLIKKVEKSDYFITNFRSKEDRKEFLKKEGKFKESVVLIERLGVPIMGVFKLNSEEK